MFPGSLPVTTGIGFTTSATLRGQEGRIMDEWIVYVQIGKVKSKKCQGNCQQCFQIVQLNVLPDKLPDK